ncbi:invasion protein [Salmonella enterica]|nr:invasion protein [Salmonella enterica]
MTWELILDGYSESSYSATPRFAAARLPWFCISGTEIFCGSVL